MKRLNAALAVFIISLLSISLAQAEAVRAFEIIGAFEYYQQIDPITDYETSFIMSFTRLDTTVGAGLFWGCKNENLTVAVVGELGVRFGEGLEKTEVRWRFDKDEPSPFQEWLIDFSDESIVILPRQRVLQFTNRAKLAEQVVIRVWDVSYTTHTYTFYLDGLSEALSRLPCAEGF